ncbi:BTAD domain-containing putative transcriptional regulator [Cellulomonas aerilata]|uniref:BTAD domain-containing putative transcriptional regulator n=1 Tax=Cellulomonas aerilata TaxID=515326 RepID=UPI0011BE090E|nr:winged helix-turn-helix domain-containing protein [Cellulomonas aerilata]
MAPPGAGKTTLMAQWAATCGTDVAWLRVDRDDGADGRLAARLSEALTDHLVLGGGPATMTQLAIAVERRTEPLVLVLDDLHTVAGTAAEADLERLLLMAPEHIRILLGSRRRPALNFARCELPRTLLVLEDDLAFRGWEVERLFRSVYRTPLSANDAADLARRTAGWAAGLHLFSLSTVGAEPTARRSGVAALGRRSRYARDYLDSEVLADVSRALRRFLARTTVFDRLTVERCDALLSRGTSRRMLTEAARLCPMVTADDAGETFVVHEVLRRHLETQFEDEVGSTQARAWWCRGADVLEATGAPVEAVRARALGGDWTGVRRLLHAGGPDLLAAGARAWADVLPAWSQEDDPWASLVVARRLLDDGRLVAATAAAERTEPRLGDPVGADLCRHVVATAAVWGVTPDLSAGDWPALLRAATRRDPASVARDTRATGSLPVPYRDLVQGLASLLAGDATSGEQALVRCTHEPNGATVPALAARLAIAFVGLLRQDAGASSRTVDQVAADADRSGLPWLARLARGVADAFDARGPARADGEPAGADAAAAVAADCDQRGDRWGALLVRAASAMAGLRDGDLDPAPFERLATRCRELDAGVPEAWMRSLHAIVAGAGDLPDALVDAESAESYARSAAVPGALCLAYAGLAVTRPEQRGELLDLASMSGAATGLGPGPWRWLGPVADLLWGPEPSVPEQPLHAPSLRAPRLPSASASDPSASRPTAPVPGRTGSRPQGPSTPALPGPAPVALRCFGEFRMAVGGQALDLSVVRPRARSVLRMLAVHAGRMVHREQLADALWADVEPSAALHSLQVNLSNLRGLLSAGVGGGRGSTLIVREGDAYGLALPDGSTCDVLDFERALGEARTAAAGPSDGRTAGALRRALEVYAGDLLPEEGPADWAAALRAQYRSQAAEAAASLASLELLRGDPAAAVAAATRSVEIDVCLDGAWRTLIAAYRLLGDLAAGERAQRRYAEVLLDLGVDLRHAPSRAGTTWTAPAASTVGVTGVRRSPPLPPPREQPGPAPGAPTRSSAPRR